MPGRRSPWTLRARRSSHFEFCSARLPGNPVPATLSSAGVRRHAQTVCGGSSATAAFFSCPTLGRTRSASPTSFRCPDALRGRAARPWKQSGTPGTRPSPGAGRRLRPAISSVRSLFKMRMSGLAAITLLAIAALSLSRLVPPRTPILTAVAPPPASARRGLTYAELLPLFPDTPVGLVTLEDGRKRLIFPHPGDEARFVRRF